MRKGGARELRKERIIWGAWMSFLWGKRMRWVFIMHVAFSFSGAWRWSTWQITFLMLDQKIPDWLVKIIFLGEVETTIILGIKSGF